ncbi:hypothetical protein GZH49_37690 [Nocardia terpenica]
MSNDAESARAVLAQYPRVLNCCDELAFDSGAQALAYLILHMPDRYCRMLQVLERLLIHARLPVGRSHNFAALDVGAGPGPGIFAIRGFYAALAVYTKLFDPSWQVAPLGCARIVERSAAMPWVMHRFAEALITAEQLRLADHDSSIHTSNLLALELQKSATPFGAHHDDFAAFDLRDEHQRARQRLAVELSEELELGMAAANRLAHDEPLAAPSGTALAVMMNFLTTAETIPRFSAAIERLMRGSLVPGGTLLAIGATGDKYSKIYSQLDDQAIAARLNIVDGFDQPLHADHRLDELATIKALTRKLWHRLETTAGDATQTKEELLRLNATDIFDDSTPFTLPRFKVRAYRRGL